MFEPEATTKGAAVCVIARSFVFTVTVLLVAVLFAGLGSELVVVTVALPVMVVPEAAPAFTVTAIGIVEVPPFARLTLEVHVNVPAFPAVTPEQVTPAGGVALKKLVFEGVANTSFGLPAAPGPLLVRTLV
jgi:hypothetical protein